MGTVGWDRECRRCGGTFSSDERYGVWYSGACGFCGVTENAEGRAGKVKVRGGAGSVRFVTKIGSVLLGGMTKGRIEQIKHHRAMRLQRRRGPVRGKQIVAAQVLQRMNGGLWCLTRVKPGGVATCVMLRTKQALIATGQELEAHRRIGHAPGDWCSSPLQVWKDRSKAARRRLLMRSWGGTNQNSENRSLVDDSLFEDIPF